MFLLCIKGEKILWITKFTQRVENCATKSKLLYNTISLYYRFLVKREVELADIKATDNVLCIGGGVCPYTAILLHKYTGAKVTVIDNDASCVRKSKRFLRRMKIENVHIKLCDGKCVCCNNYSIIHIAMQISPKELVVDEVIKGAKNGTKILIRRPKNMVKELYCSDNSCEYCCDFVKHSIFSNVDNTGMCVVNKKSAGELVSAV